MDFGIFNLMSLRDNPGGVGGVIRDTEIMVRTAEDVGFATAWFAEHHFTNYSICVSPLMLAARMSGLAQKIKMGAAVVVLPLYHPMRVAQEIALLDQMTGGRAVLGIGSGYQPYEFIRYGHDVKEKNDIFLEYWEIVEQALTEGRVRFEGKYISVPETVVTARPVQKPLPQIYVTSVDPRILKRLAKFDPIPFMTAGANGTKRLYELAANGASAWAAAGLKEPMPFALQQYIHVTDSKTEALEAADRARFVLRVGGALRDPDMAIEGTFIQEKPAPNEASLETYRDNVIIGDPHHVAERVVAEIRHLNPIHYNTFFQFGDMPIERSRRALERFGREVMPLIEKELGPLADIGRNGSGLAKAS